MKFAEDISGYESVKANSTDTWKYALPQLAEDLKKPGINVKVSVKIPDKLDNIVAYADAVEPGELRLISVP